MNMNLQEMQDLCWQIAESKDWHRDLIRNPDGSLHVAQVIALVGLCHTELTEAELEKAHYYHEESGKPAGVVVELADCKIRLLDLAGSLGIAPDVALLSCSLTTESPRVALDQITEVSRKHPLNSLVVAEAVYLAIRSVEAAANAIGYHSSLFDKILLEKCEYNRTRPSKHGKLA